MGVAGLAILFLLLLLIRNRKQGLRLKRNIQEIKNLKTGSRDYQNFFE